MRREKRAICPFCNRQIRTLDSEYAIVHYVGKGLWRLTP